MKQIDNYINGSYIPPVSGNYLENFEPATGKPYSQVADSGPNDVEQAYQAASVAFPSWSKTSLEERFLIMNRIAEGIERRMELLAVAESIDNGKPVSLARRMDIPRAAANFRFFATAAMQFASESHEMPGTAINYTLRQPIGVVGCISPWNLPLYLFTWKIAPAIATGNTVIAKPSEMTPMTAYLLGEICTEAGLPAGVLNIVQGLGPSAGQAIVSHPGIKAISFTGGTSTGAHIAATAAPVFKKLSLELGGKNAFIVFEDSDFDRVVSEAVRASFSNQGQICLCGSRIIVQESIFEKFTAAFVEKVQQLRIGDPQDENTQIGALVSEAHFHKVSSYIALAQSEGGKILTGGNSVKLSGRCTDGWFLEPTVITGLSQNCRTNQEEIFGPVVTIQSFKDEAEALVLTNDTRYGLATSLWTRDLSRTHRMSAAIQSGIIWVNCWLLRDLRTPFGGVKDSGVGREGGWEAMRFFTEAKNVCIAY
ncbi:MAG: aldehyde dehydrogenase [Saprospiraceae bacterium]|nr:aldehyde dehydrogenase [Saprospiraceae bacterium]